MHARNRLTTIAKNSHVLFDCAKPMPAMLVGCKTQWTKTSVGYRPRNLRLNAWGKCSVSRPSLQEYKCSKMTPYFFSARCPTCLQGETWRWQLSHTCLAERMYATQQMCISTLTGRVITSVTTFFTVWRTCYGVPINLAGPYVVFIFYVFRCVIHT